MSKPLFIILAGVNGSGKSTLCVSRPGYFKNITRVNADEILKSFGGNWRNYADNAKAMRIEVARIKDLFENRKSFYMETTLAGNAHSHIKRITKAKALGYQVIIHYITVSSPEMAIERVTHRVKHNGHGIPDDVIRRRYYSSKSNFELVKKYADIVYEWDNSNKNGFVTVNKTIITKS